MAEPAPLVELFNRSAQPRVIAWGEGVIMPGESFKTDDPESYGADRPGSPWATDPEATGALLRLQQAPATNPSDSSQDGPSGPQDAAGVPSTHMLAGAERMADPPSVNLVGDELVDANGNVIGRVVPEPVAEATNQAAEAAQPQQEV